MNSINSLKNKNVDRMNIINKLLRQYSKLHFSLIDPDNQIPKLAGQKAKICEEYGTNGIMVGGSTVRNRKLIYDTVKAIKENVKVPVIIFPNSAIAIPKNTDYTFIMSLLNSKEEKYLIGEPLQAAPFIKKNKIHAISIAYIVISTSSNPTTIEKKVRLEKIKINEIQKAVGYAIYANMMGFDCIYFEAGSGAEKPISTRMLKSIRNEVTTPIIVGGGIRDAETAAEIAKAGADIIVNGTAVEENITIIKDIIKSIKL